MPTKKRPQLRELPKIPKELLEQFTEGPMIAEAIEDASAAFKKAMIERALRAVSLATTWGILRARSARRMKPTSVTTKVERRF